MRHYQTLEAHDIALFTGTGPAVVIPYLRVDFPPLACAEQAEILLMQAILQTDGLAVIRLRYGEQMAATMAQGTALSFLRMLETNIRDDPDTPRD